VSGNPHTIYGWEHVTEQSIKVTYSTKLLVVMNDCGNQN
jgi:hypothetical protein